MKIIAVLEVSITSGGGFNQALNTVQQLCKLLKGKIEFSVVSTSKENINYLKLLKIEVNYFNITFLDRLLARLYSGRIWGLILAKFKIITPFEKLLIKQDCDLVYFVDNSSRAESLQILNYIVTVWDLCHRDHVEFPEVRKFGEFKAREWILQNILTPASIVIADSKELSEKISSRYGVDRDRIIPMPHCPSPFIKEIPAKDTTEILKLYQLEHGYFFYPAQFWAHKNHFRIIEAAKLLHEEGIQCQVVFVGGDQGNYTYIDEIIKDYGLSNYIKSLGFLPAEHMSALYKGCLAVVMPTFFGPTNIPPLEAWSIGKPLIYSKHLSDNVGDAAILVDSDDEISLASAMKSMLEESNSEKLVKNGFKRLEEITTMRKEAEKRLISKLLQFKKKRQCWK